MADTEHWELNHSFLKLADLYRVYREQPALKLSPELLEKVGQGRQFLEQQIAEAREPVYGINTGFGSLYNVSIEGQDLEQLQINLVRSHACGTGEELAPEITRLMILLKIKSLCYGHSGVRKELIDQLLFFYNQPLIPRIPSQGSLGASGDLAPLAHLALSLIGEGELGWGQEWLPSKEVLKKFERNALILKSKEGLALLNGTQFMSSIGCAMAFELHQLFYLADLISALSLDAYDGRIEPFHPGLHQLRPHPGQQKAARRVREFLEDSQLIQRAKLHVQDPYSFRCIPQVHGASADALSYASQTLEREINSVTDNPTLLPAENLIISGGNFHGQALALVLDHMALAASEIGNISERRTYLLISGQRALPAFLVDRPGLNSGLMIAQYSAAALVSQNKQYCTPASADSIVSSNGQEDHVSMGANAATKLLKVTENLRRILAIELICASQALFYRKDKTSPFLENFLEAFREEVPKIEQDRNLSIDITRAEKFLKDLSIEADLLFNESA